jgi:hypothetical protein
VTPTSSSIRLMKAKSLSPYCTRYLRFLYSPVIFSSVLISHSSSSFFAMSSSEICWNMR